MTANPRGGVILCIWVTLRVSDSQDAELLLGTLMAGRADGVVGFPRGAGVKRVVWEHVYVHALMCMKRAAGVQRMYT